MDFGERKSLVFERWSGDRDRASPRAEGGGGRGSGQMYAPRGAVCVGGAENGVPPNSPFVRSYSKFSAHLFPLHFYPVPFLGMHVCMHAARKDRRVTRE